MAKELIERAIIEKTSQALATQHQGDFEFLQGQASNFLKSLVQIEALQAHFYQAQKLSDKTHFLAEYMHQSDSNTQKILALQHKFQSALHNYLGKKVFLAGGPDDTDCIKKIRLELRNSDLSNFTDMFGKTQNIYELAELIKKSEILICSDSAPMHIGVATGTIMELKRFVAIEKGFVSVVVFIPDGSNLGLPLSRRKPINIIKIPPAILKAGIVIPNKERNGCPVK